LENGKKHEGNLKDQDQSTSIFLAVTTFKKVIGFLAGKMFLSNNKPGRNSFS